MDDISVSVEGPNGTIIASKKYRRGIMKKVLLSALQGIHGVGDLKDSEDYDIEPSDELVDAGAYKYFVLPSPSAGLEGGMQIGLESGKRVESYHPLSQFVACLQDATLQKSINDAKPDSMIELPKGVVWLGDEDNFSNQLLMRPCYFELLEAKEEYFKQNSTLRAVVYTGTPGIGKSHMCAFVVARKLIAGTVVYFERAQKSDKDVEERVVYRLELTKCVYSFKSSLVLDFLSRNENAVYIVDGLYAGFSKAHVEIQIFASPSQALFRPQRKVWSGYLYLHTPLFDLQPGVWRRLC